MTAHDRPQMTARAARMLMMLMMMMTLVTGRPQDIIRHPETTAVSAGQRCTSSDGRSGVCRRLDACRPVLENVTRGIYGHHRCGFDNYTEMVCCEPSSGRTGERVGGRSAEECRKYKEGKDELRFFILQGEAAGRGEFPHMAALGYAVKGTRGLSWLCGGSLISDSVVLTAAHCVRTGSTVGPPVVVRLGHTHLYADADTGRDFPVEGHVVHPRYKKNVGYYDIAVVRTVRRVQLSRWIYPACVDTGRRVAASTLVVTGWGDTTGTGAVPSPHLLKASLQEVSQDACDKEYKADNRVPRGILPVMICAGSSDNRDTCQGDSGGPLQVLEDLKDTVHTVVGVTSFGPSPCGGRKPGVYTRVATVLSWIESTVSS